MDRPGRWFGSRSRGEAKAAFLVVPGGRGQRMMRQPSTSPILCLRCFLMLHAFGPCRGSRQRRRPLPITPWHSVAVLAGWSWTSCVAFQRVLLVFVEHDGGPGGLGRQWRRWSATSSWSASSAVQNAFAAAVRWSGVWAPRFWRFVGLVGSGIVGGELLVLWLWMVSCWSGFGFFMVRV